MKAIIAIMVAACMVPFMVGEADGARCSLNVNGDIDYDATTPDGLPRSNPNDTVYPGDAFLYSFDYRFSSGCIGARVGSVTSHDAVEDETEDRSGRVGRSGSVEGIGVILIDESLECIEEWDSSRTGRCGWLEIKISAKERRCSTNDEGVTRCWYVTKRDSARVYPAILAPDVILNLTERVLRDTDGYNATNRDHTSYVWDPIAVRHDVDFAWKDERSGTITFGYNRTFGGLVEDAGHECVEPCMVTLGPPANPVSIGFLPYELEAGNGDGMYVYTAPSLDEAGLHGIHYDLIVYNLNRTIAANSSDTSRLVVEYEPSFTYYPYTVLVDSQRWAYDDRHGIALNYLGSGGTGPDDTPGLHAERRSKINAFDAVTTIIPDIGSVETIITDPYLLEWGSAHGPLSKPAGPFLSLGDHAMFYYEGYGTIRFSQTLTDILDKYTRELYNNVTTTNALISDSWAGSASNLLLTYNYTYPPTVFAIWFNVTAESGTPLSVKMIEPDVIVDGDGLVDGEELGYREPANVMIDDYLVAKTMHDTGDATFANIVLNDTYGMDNMVTGSGSISMWNNKTIVEVSDVTAEIQGYDPSWTGILDMPRHVALALPSIATFEVEAGGIIRNFTVSIDTEFGHHEFIILGNATSETGHSHNRTSEVVSFRLEEGFGAVREVLVNGVPTIHYGSICQELCTVNVGVEAANVTVLNHYGGVATFMVEPVAAHVPDRPEEPIEQNEIALIALLATISLMTFIIVKVIKRININD